MQERRKLGALWTTAFMMILIVARASGAPAGMQVVPGQESVDGSATTLVVTSTADSGPGTLRQALQDAQSGDTIAFDPVIFPPTAPVTISVTSPLPHIHQSNVTLDGSHAAVILDGSHVPGDWEAGLQIVSSNGNRIQGLQIAHFSGPAIAISGDAKQNVIGGDRSLGTGPSGQGNLFRHNAIGVDLSTTGTKLNTITGNLIGTDAAGADGLGNQRSGVWISEGAHRNIIGPDNVIAYNAGAGIEMHDPDTVHNTITQNSIHDNGGDGIHLWAGGNNELAAPLILEYDLQTGTMNGFSCAHCTVEVYSDADDEGESYEGRTTADGSGFFAFSKGTAFAGPHLTATATDAPGNTSGFSFPTSDTGRAMIIQSGNSLPRTQLQARRSRDLEDNRIGTSFNGFGYPEFYDLGLYDLGYKRARASINSIEGFTDDWSRPELSIHPSHDALFTRLADNGFVTTYVLTFWDKATYPDADSVPCPRFKTEPEIQRYLDFVEFIVGHFKDRVQVYEIWNEPDNATCPQWIKVEDYVHLVQRVVPVIRQEYPKARIKVGSVAGLTNPPSEAYLFGILESNIMPLVDVVAWHPFYGNSPEHDAEYYNEYPSIVQEIKDVASAHGFDGQFAVDEMTWRTPENAHPDDPWTYSKAAAAKYYGRGIVMHLGMDIAAGVAGEGYDQIAPIVSIVRNLNTVMAGARSESLPMEVQSGATNLVSYTFTLDNGDRLIALWTDGIAVDNEPGIEATLTLPSVSDHAVTGIDVLFGFQQQMVTTEERDSLVIRDLLVKDYPIIFRVTPIKFIFLPLVLKGYAQ